MAAISISHVTKTYPARRGATPLTAVDDVSIEIPAGTIHAIIGYSGAGKSTLLRLINGLERATSGEIRIGDSANLATLSERELRVIRSQIGMIFQHFNLFNSKTVAQNVEFPLRVAAKYGLQMSAAERRQRVAQLLDFVGLADRATAYPEQLSGGQKQRVGIARALATNPQVLLADEATSALDPDTSAEVLRLLSRVNRELGITIVLITHEMDVVREIADTVTVMEAGKVVEQGPVFEVFATPKAAVTAKFVATALPTQPDAARIQRLLAEGAGKLVTLTFSDQNVDQPLVFQTLADRGVGVNIVHGGITTVGGRSFGKLTLQLLGEELRVTHAVAALGQHVDLEVLG